ncbi:DUF418 domain-containing protein [Dactylosporangium aurantiacum]|uniref:DUF418 domain-containing protein n=1 Tax=Dactylosporangium aurantiacum TaxID=35754 RepID=A0A9Q9ILS7_9ACTN|nr:DUF418 domain-containing protein [Dactylosporangium aurantiacum]MDG6108312.1 DUF418 domain-containing protein [Dactylosporangium aurantiacum]UWZ58499.1 DUF418 domain-containing protein [Dactylosporangium aurantiacum]
MTSIQSAPHARGAAGGAARLPVVDALRGLALLGILLVNMTLFKSAPSIEHLAATAIDGPWDRAAAVLVKVLGEGKFIGLFSLLFGFGVATLAARRASYLRRLAALGAIGAAHLVLVWFGDILTTYALVGLVLLAFVGRRPRTLLATALGILGALSTVAVIGLGLLGLRATTGSSALVAAERDITAADATEAARLTALYRTGGWLDLVRERAETPGGLLFGLAFSLVVLSMMLLGVYAARTGLFTGDPAHRPRLRRLARVGIGAGLPLNLLVVVVQSAGGFFVVAGQILLMALAAPLLTVGLAAAGVMLYERRRAPWLEAAGRLALTNYLLQSVVFTTVYYSYGFGLYGRVGAATGAALAVVLYLAQLAASRWWLARFGAGPVERLLRRATYGGRR